MVHALTARPRDHGAERHAAQVAVLVAIAAHLFLAVWLLRSLRPPEPVIPDAPPVYVNAYHTPPRLPATQRVASAPPSHRRSVASAAPAASRASDAPPSRATDGAVTPGNDAVNDAATLPGQANASARGIDDSSGLGGDGLRMATRFAPPKVLQHWAAPYPEAAVADGAEGGVQLRVTIDAQGNLVAAQVATSSGNHALDEAALASVRHYRFKAGERDGVPIEMDAYIDLHFRISAADIHRTSDAAARILPPNFAGKRADVRHGSYLGNEAIDKAMQPQ